ncbi:MAG: hypothetical protein J2P17_00635 [Mycobacterium sp.]|nr:hypothetical protein [Mycobacterium sp.]
MIGQPLLPARRGLDLDRHAAVRRVDVNDGMHSGPGCGVVDSEVRLLASGGRRALTDATR